MANVCQLTPLSAFQSTNLSSKIHCYDRLGQRILRQMGFPMVSVELHRDMIYENIDISVEMFSKFAGYTHEFLVFNSDIYERGKGIKLDTLFTFANVHGLEKRLKQDKPPTPSSPAYSNTTSQTTNYVVLSAVDGSYFDNINNVDVNQDLTSKEFEVIKDSLSSGVPQLRVYDEFTYEKIVKYFPNFGTAANIKESVNPLHINCEPVKGEVEWNNMFDYDVMDYRKIIDVVDFTEGSSNGVNTLFTLEQTLAQQTFFSYALGNYGFDLVSWYAIREWMEMREKVLAIKKAWKFDERTQYLTMIPEPADAQFYGVVSCYVERPIRDSIKEQWVMQYALALSKIAVGRVRGKFSNVNLLGGGTFNFNDILQEGLAEKKELEQTLLTGASTAFGDGAPAPFIVG